MLHLRPIIREEVKQLVPLSIINEISSFTFYDKNPTDGFDLDIIICTKEGEIIEFFQRNVVLKTLISTREPKEIQIHRNPEGFHYVIHAQSDLFILKRRSYALELVKTFKGIRNYEFKDISRCGEEHLKVWIEDDDALPLVYNYKFTYYPHNKEVALEDMDKNELLKLSPVLNVQRCKLTAAKFVVNTNECTLNQLQREIKELAYGMYCRMHPQLDNCAFKKENQVSIGILNSMISTPLIKYCNNKLVIIFNVYNENDETINDLDIIVHNSHTSVITYDTKMYIKSATVPFWIENVTKSILGKENATILTIIDLNEFNDYVGLKIQLYGHILYKLNDTLKILPFGNINISHKDLMNDEYNILISKCHDTEDILAIIASSVQTNINITHISPEITKYIPLLRIFCEFMDMENVSADSSDIIIYENSPYNKLHGVMICLDRVTEDNDYQLSVYSRCKSQVIALIHYIFDSVPFKLLVTLPQMQVKSVDGKIVIKPTIPDTKPDYTDYTASLIQQMNIVLKFYDECMVKMGQSKSKDVLSNIGSQINLDIGGKEHMDEFVKNLNKEILNGFECLASRVPRKIESDVNEFDDGINDDDHDDDEDDNDDDDEVIEIDSEDDLINAPMRSYEL